MAKARSFLANFSCNTIALLDYNPSSNQVTDHSSLFAGFTGTPCSLAYADGNLYLSGFTGSSDPLLTALDNSLKVDDLTTFVPSSFGVIDTIAISGGNIFISGGTFNSVQYGLLTPGVQTCTLTFTESGLPPGTSWSVTLVNKAITIPSYSNAISFTVNSGTSNSYMIQSPIVVGQFTFASLPASSGTVNVDGTNVNVAILYSAFVPNWAGYVAVSDLSNPQPVVTAVNGSWIVQSVTPTLLPSYSSQWIGIGGALSGDSSLIQTGTASLSAAGLTDYYVWYEILPWTPLRLPALLYTVKPGDAMQAEIFLVDKTTNLWNITINDLTENWHFWHLVYYGSSMLSAEWIEEHQWNSIGPLADFGVARFGQDYTSVANTNYATIGSTTALISNLPANAAVTMLDSTGQVLAQPSPLTSDGSFTVTWYTGGRVPWKSALVTFLFSSANMFLTDPEGRHIGFDPSTRLVVNEIPGAFYSGPASEPQFLLIPEPINGTYSITLIGTENGNYTMTIEYITPILATTETFNGTISPQETKYYSTLLSGNQQTAISWEYVFKDPIRGTMLKISTDDKYFQFTAPHKDFGVKNNPNMLVSKRTIVICYSDKTMGLLAGVDQTLGFCTAVAWDKQTCKMYMLIYFLHPPRCWHSLVQ